MKTTITPNQLEQAADYSNDLDAVLLLRSDGTTSVIDCDDIAPYQQPGANLQYVCRIGAVRSLIRTHGTDGAADQINRMLPAPNRLTEES